MYLLDHLDLKREYIYQMEDRGKEDNGRTFKETYFSILTKRTKKTRNSNYSSNPKIKVKNRRKTR